jgi:hypothetical protein
MRVWGARRCLCPRAAPRRTDPGAIASRHRLAGSPDGACGQLREDRGCSLHAVTGWQPLPPCQLYPVRAMRPPDG